VESSPQSPGILTIRGFPLIGRWPPSTARPSLSAPRCARLTKGVRALIPRPGGSASQWSASSRSMSRMMAGTDHGPELTLVPGMCRSLDDPAQSLRAREGWFDSVAFLISFSPGIPFPGSQIKSKSCGSFFFRRNQFGFLSGAAMGATKQNEQPM